MEPHKESYQRSTSRSQWTISLSAAPASNVARTTSVQVQEEGMKHAALAALLGAVLTMLSTSTGAQPAITAQEAHAIADDAYLSFYPLALMDVTRKQSTNIEAGKEFGRGPMNAVTSVAEYPPADFKGVVRVNFDTPYSIAWLDLTKEPIIVSAPNTDGR